VQVPPRNSGNSLIQKPSVAIKREKGNKKRLGKKGHMICNRKYKHMGTGDYTAYNLEKRVNTIVKTRN
jgi:hypothetical protein